MTHEEVIRENRSSERPVSPLPCRIGAVSYLNTKPLVHGLPVRSASWQLELDLPSRLATRLAAGDLDVALIPSISFWQDPSYRIVSDACIACRGPVRSVKLVARTPLEQIRTLAVDEGSCTSGTLARILLREKLGLEPELVPFPIDVDLHDVAADAVVVIGDRAMHVEGAPFVRTWDLGDVWNRRFGLPFVFAVWVARPDIDIEPVRRRLEQARDEGVRKIESIAQAEAPKLGWTVDDGVQYLRDHLHFTLGPKELAGMELFYRHAVRWGLAPDGWESSAVAASLENACE